MLRLGPFLQFNPFVENIDVAYISGFTLVP